MSDLPPEDERAERPERGERGERGPEPRGAPPRRDRLRGIARRLFRELEEEAEGEPGAEDRPRPDRSEARDLLASMLETGDKAKTEIVRLVAREFRGYLEALELHKDLHHLLTNYSLEVRASVHLRPLADELRGAPAGEPGVRVGLKPRPAEGDEAEATSEERRPAERRPAERRPADRRPPEPEDA